MKRTKGFFITFEGSEGSGKSTQSGLLTRFLKEQGYAVVQLREPGGTSVGEKIRSILLDNRNGSITAQCEMLLYMAARAQIVQEVIAPALAAGKVVICDRFLDSTIAYQGFGLGVDIRLIREVGRFATCGIRPDLTIFLDLPVRKGLKHRERSMDRIEQRAFAYHLRVRRGYLALARLEPARFKTVRVEQEKRLTQEKIRLFVMRMLKGRKVRCR